MEDDLFQLTNLADDPRYAAHTAELTAVLHQWMEKTGDSVPQRISPDTFHRETGERLVDSDTLRPDVMTPGEDRQADRVNHPGPF